MINSIPHSPIGSPIAAPDDPVSPMSAGAHRSPGLCLCGRLWPVPAVLPVVLLIALVAVFSTSAAAVVWPLDPEDDLVGELIHDRVRGDETLIDIARMHNIGHFEIRHANPGLDAWLPVKDTEVLIPQLHILPDAPREGIVVNLAERRLYYFSESWPDRDGPVVSTHPVGVGLLDRATPVTVTSVTAKIDDPAWYPTPAVRDWYRREKNEILPVVVPAGPDNPLGRHAMILDGDGLLIHGTHRPAGVGMRVSQGCIRLYPESIANLIGQVPVGTTVRIIDQPYKLGWRAGQLYLELEPAGEQDNAGHPESLWLDVQQAIRARAEERDGVDIDWQTARAAFDRADSVPTNIASQDRLAARAPERVQSPDS